MYETTSFCNTDYHLYLFKKKLHLLLGIDVISVWICGILLVIDVRSLSIAVVGIFEWVKSLDCEVWVEVDGGWAIGWGRGTTLKRTEGIDRWIMSHCLSLASHSLTVSHYSNFIFII